MKTLLASTAIALSFVTPALADAHMTSAFVPSIDTQALRASDLIGARLYVTEQDGELTSDMSTDWDDVGEISDIVIGSEGGVDAVLTDIGGFLGIGERTVAVNMDDLQFVSDGDDADDYFIVLTGSTADLEGAPEFNQEFERGRAAGMMPAGEMTTETAGTDGMATTAPETEMAADTEMEPAEGADTEMAADTEMEPAEGTDTEMAADTEMEPAEGTDTEMATDTEMTTETDTAATEMAPEAEQVEETDTAGTGLDTQSTASTETIDTVDTDLADAEEPIAGDTDVQEEVVATDPAMTGTAPMMEREGYTQVANTEMTTDDLTGARVYGANDEDIGEIGELILSDDNMLDKAIIDVGGFLGLGEKPVAVEMDDVTILRGENDIRVYVNATEEQLTEMPAYEGN